MLHILHSLRKGSGQSDSNVHILCSIPTYRLTNSVPVLGFFLVTGNSALIMSRLSGSCRLQVPVQLSTLLFHSYIRSVHARASDAPHFRFFFHYLRVVVGHLACNFSPVWCCSGRVRVRVWWGLFPFTSSVYALHFAYVVSHIDWCQGHSAAHVSLKSVCSSSIAVP